MNHTTNTLYYKTEYPDDTFPINLYTITKYSCVPPGRGYKDLHWHDAVQFTMVQKGRLSMRVNGDDFDLMEGDGIFVNSGLLHVTNNISEDGVYVSLDFPEKMLSFYPGSRMEQKFVLPYINNGALPAILLKPEIHWQQSILSLLWELRDELTTKKDFAYEYSAAMKISMIWHQLISNIRFDVLPPSSSLSRRQERVQTLIAFIQNNFDSNITIKDIANSANISTAECFRCFKSIIHLSPYEYLTKYRINRSIDLLNETASCITEISGQVGFNYASQYIKAFKKIIGLTPNEYRTCQSREFQRK